MVDILKYRHLRQYAIIDEYDSSLEHAEIPVCRVSIESFIHR